MEALILAAGFGSRLSKPLNKKPTFDDPTQIHKYETYHVKGRVYMRK